VTTRALAFVVALATSACIAKRTPAWSAPGEPFGTVSEEILADLVADGDRAWQKRDQPGQLDEAARAYAAALRYRPSDAGVLLHLARVALRRAQMARGAAAAEHFDEATAFAERALAARNPVLGAAARAGEPPEKLFAHAEPADAAALVVYAEALLRWAISHGTPTVLKYRLAIAHAAERALAFDPAVGWGAPNRVLGTLDCELPEARQNVRDALERFEAAVAAAPAYLPTRLAYAEEYATRTHDAALYRRLVDEVAAADAKALPEAAPENREAQQLARDLIRSRR
jgi:hypothetical protein